MAQLIVDGGDLRIVLKRREKFLTFHGDLSVPLRSIRRIVIPTEPWSNLRGWRVTGFALPGYAAMGKRRHGYGYDFTLMWKTERPILRLECGGFEFEHITVSVDDARAIGARIAEAAGITFDAGT